MWKEGCGQRHGEWDMIGNYFLWTTVLRVNSKGSERKGSRAEVTISEKQKRTVHVGMLSASSGVAGPPCHVTS